MGQTRSGDLADLYRPGGYLLPRWPAGSRAQAVGGRVAVRLADATLWLLVSAFNKKIRHST